MLVLRASGQCTYTLYAGAHYEQHGRVTTENRDPVWDVCGAQQTSYFNAGGQAVALRSTYPYEEAPFQWEMTSTVHYLHRDRLGSLTEVTDEDGLLVGRARYDAYGRILSNTIPLTLTTRLYAWSDYDPATGLYKIGARWYDPQLGVWLTPDSLVPDVNNPKAWNPYAFNYQNPIQYVDPSGHFPWLLAAGVFALGGFGGHLAATSAGYDVGSTQWFASVGLGGVFAVGGFGLGYAGYGVGALALGIAGDTAIDAAVLGKPFWPSLARNTAINVAFDVAGYAIGRALRSTGKSAAQAAPADAATLRAGLDAEGGIIPVRRGEVTLETLRDLAGGSEVAYIRDRSTKQLYLVQGGLNPRRVSVSGLRLPQSYRLIAHTHPGKLIIHAYPSIGGDVAQLSMKAVNQFSSVIVSEGGYIVRFTRTPYREWLIGGLD